MTASKGVSELASAFADAPDCHIAFVGEGDPAQYVSSLVRRGGGGAEEFINLSGGGFLYDDSDDLIARVRELAADARVAQTHGKRANSGLHQPLHSGEASGSSTPYDED